MPADHDPRVRSPLPVSRAPPRGLSLTRRVMLLVGGLVVGVVAIYAAATYRELRRAALALAQDRLEAIAGELLRSTGAARAQVGAVLQGVARDRVIRALVLEASAAGRAAALGRLKAAEDPPSQVLATQVVASDGREILATGPRGSWSSPSVVGAALRELRDSASGGVGLLRAFGDTVTFPVVERVVVNGEPRGAVVQWRRYEVRGLDQLNRLLGARTAVYIGNRAGDVWTDLEARAAAPPVDIVGAHGLLMYDRPAGAVLAVGRVVPGTPWAVAVESSQRDVLASTREFVARLDVIGAGVLLVGLFGAAWVSRGITRPLARLTGAVELVAAGDYTHHTGLAPRGDEVGRLAVAFDTMVSAVRESFEAIRRSEENYRRLIRESPDGITLATLDGRFLTVNPAFVEMLGYAGEDELLAVNARDLYAEPGEREELMRKMQDTGFLQRRSLQLRRKDGTVIVTRFTGRIVRPADGDAYVEAISEDVTRQLQLEQQFHQAQKMEAVGQLAGGVAHDLNNMLTVIISYCDLLLGELEATDARRGDIQAIQSAGESASTLTRQLLVFSRQNVLQPRAMRLNELVTGTGKMLQRLIGEDIELATALDPEAGALKVDPAQMEQVIVNLAVNARDAMPRGGRLLIESKNVEFAEPVTDQTSLVPAGRYVTLAVSDTGVGMSADVRARIFEPFFTTKSAGRGTGLGLAVVYGIVQQSGGHIHVYSEPDRGTSFKIFFPRVDATVEAAELQAIPVEPPRGTETILIVEDEAAVRNIVHLVLEKLGYRVLETPDGERALDLAGRHVGPIDLLLTDVVMPKMSGRDLADRFRSLRPRARVLFVSGYTDDAVVRHGVLESGVHFLAKPFTPDVLAKRVREVLG